ncbi:MAG: type VI secretion system tube protein Hcp [Bryobacterales bacterium]|nr:type VI secretion system tube protein Hcp [Bryobacterales bacterium]
MASDYLLEIDGVKGESVDNKFPGSLEIDSFSWGVSNSGSFSSGTGGGAGKASAQDFHFVTRCSKASPDLMNRCTTGKAIDKVTLHLRKQGEDGQLEFYTWTMENCLISSFQTGGSEGLPHDQCSFNFAKIKIEYKDQDNQNKLKPASMFGYNFQKNKSE